MYPTPSIVHLHLPFFTLHPTPPHSAPSNLPQPSNYRFSPESIREKYRARRKLLRSLGTDSKESILLEYNIKTR